MKQLPRLWYERLVEFLFEKLSLHQVYTDYSIFVINKRVCGPIIITFVDDLNIFALWNSEIILQIKKELVPDYDMVDMRPLAFYI